MTEIILANAKLVLKNEVVRGSVKLVDGKISSINQGSTSVPGTQDFEGDYLLPGLVELHSDNIEKHFSPRPGVAWPSLSAAVAHDAQMATAGVTTVFDAVRVGDTFRRNGEDNQRHLRMAAAIDEARSKNSFRADHKIHVRCEISYADVVGGFEALETKTDVSLVSLMDHTPGQRQFVDIEKFAEYYQGKYGLTDEQLEEYIADLNKAHIENSPKNRNALVEVCQARGFPMASHDDATEAHVEEAADAGVVIAEFPTTCEAAKAARQYDLKILMGAPNLVLGKSHSGNVSALSLASDGTLDILSSDYVPASLLHGVFILADADLDISLPEAVAKASRNPANAAGLADRGEIAPGKRADLIRVKQQGSLPVARCVWREGERIV